jgi:hypothetical protein
MIKLLEIFSLYKGKVLVKTVKKYNKTDVFNQIRALPGIVTLTVEHSDFLDSKATDNHEYANLTLKYVGTSDPIASLKNIKQTSLKIPGVLKFEIQKSKKIELVNRL